MKVLVLAEKYSTKEVVSQAFIHTRNCEYIKNGIKVDVISFASKASYELDGINVFSLEEFNQQKKLKEYDIVISHAPNIRNHAKFINRNKNKMNKIVFFFHGHEVLRTKEIYPKPYDFVKDSSFIKRTVKSIYDNIKILYMSKFLNKLINISTFVFVSEWMYNQFKKNIKISEDKYKDRSHIIYNSMGEIFLNNNYDEKSEKEYDFITIRNMLDVSKYCIDVVNNIAKNNPNYKFLVIGKGEFFKHNTAPSNLAYELKNLTHKEIVEYLNNSKCALMPTRADAQGVMMCEMATFGIPVITSDIPVCKQVLGDVKNIAFINNDDTNINLANIINKFEKSKEKCTKFSFDNTILKEIKLLEEMYGQEKQAI